MKKTIFFTGGGTLGHVIPNVPLMEHFESDQWKVCYIGSYKGIEREKINALGLKYYPVRSGKLRRYFDFQNFLDIFNVAIAIIQCLGIFLVNRPKLLFSKGGYVALPPVIAAWLLRIPVVIHESDKSPGLTTRISKRFARKICVSFDNTLKYFDATKVTWTGLPVRRQVLNADRAEGLKICDFNGNRKILLVFGGSLGAGFLNNIVRQALLDGHLDAFDVVNICGKGNVDASFKQENYKQFELLGDSFLNVMAMADLVITRGGATSLFELLAMKKKHLIIPLSKKSSRGDQIENAAYFNEIGVSTFIEEDDCTVDTLMDAIQKLDESDAFLNKMEELNFAAASEKVIQVMKQVIG